jgi:hypothetical protein
MKAEHTPAPWTFADDFLTPDRKNYDFWVRDDNKKGICEIKRRGYGEAIANARLISSAPELLEALKWTERALDKEHPAAIKARVAIAKAEGA